ncbi:retinol dehydrogenase 16-like [Ambystoma mexicanum]|uniref:retinol dehydrogenase 16-like n=1 Tax=Ambystoma mexicanum TaxID=8296 RepID=UPI0037E9BDE4
MWLCLAGLLGLYYLFRWYRERQSIPNLPDKYVLITGCDTGFGHLLAKQLDRRGLCVLAACLTQKGAEQLKEAASQRLQTVILDVTSSKSVADAAEWVKQQVGDRGLWGLVNNAGISIPTAPNEWLTKSDFQRMLDVNLLGVIDVTLKMTPLVRKARGRIVNVSSVMGRISVLGGGYCISKYGVEAFSDSIRRELSPFGVKVAMIEPGFFNTPVTDPRVVGESVTQAWEKASPEVKHSYGQHYFENVCKLSNDILAKCSSNLSLVTDCMEHGLTALHPRTRYSAGWDAKLIYIPISYLPTAVADRLIALVRADKRA